MSEGAGECTRRPSACNERYCYFSGAGLIINDPDQGALITEETPSYCAEHTGSRLRPARKKREVSSRLVNRLARDWGVKTVLVLWDRSVLKGFVAGFS